MSLSVDLSGKVALVTGSTSGMGQAMARIFAANGAAVAVHGLGDEVEIRRFTAELEAAGRARVLRYDHDLSHAPAAQDLVTQTIEDFGRLDILVNNAGIQHVSRLDEFPTDAWDRVHAVNLSAAFFATRAALRGMRERLWGRIINTSSTLGLVAEEHKAAYVSSKHAIIGLTRATALDTARDGITCNAICPGWVLTPLAQRQVVSMAEKLGLTIEETVRDHFLALQPTRRFVLVEEIAATALFLCSAGAASITGVALPVDGGQLAI